VRKQMGEIVVDHRASPGLPEDVARLVGYDPKLCREGKLYEAETLTCKHCKGVLVKNIFRNRERHYCFKCSYRYICDGCAYEMTLPDYDHTPFEKKAELIMLHELQGSPAKLLIP
jgi:hypothetical protein